LGQCEFALTLKLCVQQHVYWLYADVQVKGGAAGPRPAPDASYQPAITSSSESGSEDEGGSPGAEAPGAGDNIKAAADLQREEAERQALKDRILQQYAADSEDDDGHEGSQVGGHEVSTVLGFTTM
jgi:hypothetical protein